MACPMGVDPRLAQAVQPIGRQVELHLVPGAARKEPAVIWVLVQETVQKLWTHLIGALANRRSDNGADMVARRTLGLHGINRRL